MFCPSFGIFVITSRRCRFRSFECGQSQCGTRIVELCIPFLFVGIEDGRFARQLRTLRVSCGEEPQLWRGTAAVSIMRVWRPCPLRVPSRGGFSHFISFLLETKFFQLIFFYRMFVVL